MATPLTTSGVATVDYNLLPNEVSILIPDLSISNTFDGCEGGGGRGGGVGWRFGLCTTMGGAVGTTLGCLTALTLLNGLQRRVRALRF